MRVFLDANVVFSAAFSPNGRSLALFRLAAIGRATLHVSSHVLGEAHRNLTVKAEHRMDDLGVLVKQMQLVAEASPKLASWATEHGLPASDAPVLAAAVSGQAEYLVTGDRTHFGHLFGQRVGGVTVVSPAEMLSTLLDNVGE